MNRLIIDENVDYALVKALRMSGYEVISIVEDYRGVNDQVVLELAEVNQAVLITEDKDFGELTYRLHKMSFGILLIRLFNPKEKEKIDIIQNVIKNYINEIKGNFAVLSDTKLRIKAIK